MTILRPLGLVFGTLPRWFAAPVMVGAVLIGAGVSGGSVQWDLLVLAVLTALAVMAWGHAMNTVLDYYWTKLDQDSDPSRRSKAKPYTVGQQILEHEPGITVIAGCLFWLMVSVALILSLAIATERTEVLVFGSLGLVATFAYSWGKLHWLPEVVLGVSFATLPGLLGGSTSLGPDYLRAALATLPLFIGFGFGAEIFDQWYDAEANWDKGLRNIGAWVWHSHYPIGVVVSFAVLGTAIAHAVLVYLGVYRLEMLFPMLLLYRVWVTNAGMSQGRILMLLATLSLYCLSLGVLEVL